MAEQAAGESLAHPPGCWRRPGHHPCAVEKIRQQARENYELRVRADSAGQPSPEQMLREFHAAAGLPLPEVATARPELGSQTGRAAIVAEELRELADAIEARDIVEIADACADVVYGVIGTAVTYGIPFDAVLAEVHRSNMTKVRPGPPVLNGDGKVLKGPGYERPQIAALLGLIGDPDA
jgi:NTP pyrophosphatase (non-canonical NTP hydrolase)